MKRALLSVCFLVVAQILMADMPGNKPRQAVHVIVQFNKLNGYKIYSSGSYASDYKNTEVKDSSDHVLAGGFGAPPCIAFFGINKQEKFTDTLTICNEEQGTVRLMIGVENNRLVYEQKVEVVKEEIATIPGDKGKPPVAKRPVTLLGLVALAAMLLLSGIYFSQRKKQAI